jgi:hypothetical protein
MDGNSFAESFNEFINSNTSDTISKSDLIQAYIDAFNHNVNNDYSHLTSCPTCHWVYDSRGACLLHCYLCHKLVCSKCWNWDEAIIMPDGTKVCNHKLHESE